MCGVPGLSFHKFTHVKELVIAEEHVRSTTIENLSILKNLEKLTIPTQFSSLSQLTTLKELRVRDICDLEELSELSNLTSLNVRRLEISSYGTCLPNLKNLRVRDANPGWFQYRLWTNLETLSLCNKEVLWDEDEEAEGSELYPSNFEAIEAMTNLTSLSFPGRLPPQVMRLTKLQRLQNLCPPGDVVFSADTMLEQFPKLKDFSHVPSQYDKLMHLTRLDYINSVDQNVKNPDLSMLTNLMRLKTTLADQPVVSFPPSLRHLHYNHSLTDDQVSSLTNLTVLKLTGRVDVPSLSLLTSLTVLKCTGEFGACEFESFPNLTHLTNLTSLELPQHVVPDDVIKQLHKLVRVTRNTTFADPEGDFDCVDVRVSDW